MAKLIEYDLTDSDPEKAKAGSFEPPKPGIYECKVKEVNFGYSKNDDGSEDEERPRLEVIIEVQGPTNKGALLWTYPTFTGSGKWKLDQFLMAVGIASEKSKRKGKFDPAKVVGTPIKVRVRGGKNQSGDYRAEVGSMMPFDGASSSGDDDLLDDDEVMEDEEVTEDDRRAELEALKVSDLKPIAKDLGLTLSDFKTKGDLIDGIMDAEADLPDDDEVIEDDEEEIIEDDDEVIEDDGYSEEDLKAMDVAGLKAAAEEVGYTIPKGSKKSDVISGILAAQGSSVDDDEVPF